MAPVAVEPREIIKPEDSKIATSSVADEEPSEPEAEMASAGGETGLPLIPILAGVVALVVVGLLGKVLMAK